MRSASRGGPFLKPKVSRVSASLPPSSPPSISSAIRRRSSAAGQVAGVHHHVGALAQRRQQLALGADPLDDPPLRRQRVAAAGLLVAVEQGLLVGLEEEHRRLQAVGVEVVEHLQQVVEVLAAAHVGDDRGALDAAALVAEELAEAVDHPRRQVVDAEVAAVLEGGDRLRLPGPGVAGDDDQGHLAVTTCLSRSC